MTSQKSKQGSYLKGPKCTRCTQIGHTFKKCTTEADTLSCWNCGKGCGHVTINCHDIKCSKCNGDHYQYYCPLIINVKPCTICSLFSHNDDNCFHPSCSNCGKFTHYLERCPKGPCVNCGSVEHAGPDCIRCKICSRYGHSIKSCPNRICSICSNTGHHRNECPDRECAYCKELGHSLEYCPVITCKNCKAKGHSDKVCTEEKKEIICNLCNGAGHIARMCTKNKNGSNGNNGKNKCQFCDAEGYNQYNCPCRQFNRRLR